MDYSSIAISSSKFCHPEREKLVENIGRKSGWENRGWKINTELMEKEYSIREHGKTTAICATFVRVLHSNTFPLGVTQTRHGIAARLMGL